MNNPRIINFKTVTETFTKDFFETDSSTITTVSPRERVCFASSSSLGSDLDEVSSGFHTCYKALRFLLYHH